MKNNVVTELIPPTNGKRLNVGSGKTPEPGWVNLDAYDKHADIREDFIQYSKGTQDRYTQIMMSHVLEHVARPNTMHFLRAAYNILESGGELIVIVPDFDYIAECWSRYTDIWRYLDLHDRVYGLQTHEGEFHRSAWNSYHLKNSLIHVGFEDVWTSYSWDHEQRTVIGGGKKNAV